MDSFCIEKDSSKQNINILVNLPLSEAILVNNFWNKVSFGDDIHD